MRRAKLQHLLKNAFSFVRFVHFVGNNMSDEEGFVVSLFFEFYTNHVGDLHHPSFESDMILNVRELAEMQLETKLDDAFLDACFDLFSLMYPCRTSRHCPPQPDFEAALQRMREQPNHAQRSPEWYSTRHNLITASSAYKMFGTPSEKNALIVEKCADEKERPPLSVHDARHWGVRYEPVSVQYYQSVTGTTVEEFGCIVHEEHAFLGASPDGINVLPGVDVYGRMLEIKNPVSRVITGEPTLEYWIQMQLQMEVCQVDACDFLETRFVEYASRDAFLGDGGFSLSVDGKPKGTILFFMRDGKYVYEYAPYGASEAETNAWEAEQMEVVGRDFVQPLFWKLEQVSCVLVLRNRDWFRAHLDEMVSFWTLIQNERDNGDWSKRVPVKKSVW